MTPAFDVNALVQRPPQAVWDTFTRWELAPRWMQGIDSLHAEGPLAVGSRLVFHARGQDRPAEVTALEPGQSLTLRSVQGPVCADYRYSLEPEGPHTRLRLVARCEVRGWMALFAPLLRWVIRRTDSGQVQALKRLVEA